MCDQPLPRIVSVGGVEKQELRQRLREHRVQLNQAADSLFKDERFITLSQPTTMEVVCLSVADLGFADGARYEQLTARAHESRLSECPLELGPHLRLQFLDQAEGASPAVASRHCAPPGAITIASAPLDGTDETPKGFYLRRIAGVLWLRGFWSGPDHLWNSGDYFVFVRS